MRRCDTGLKLEPEATNFRRREIHNKTLSVPEDAFGGDNRLNDN